MKGNFLGNFWKPNTRKASNEDVFEVSYIGNRSWFPTTPVGVGNQETGNFLRGEPCRESNPVLKANVV